jgi:cadmium resistance protein CadD (predicted permease)
MDDSHGQRRTNSKAQKIIIGAAIGLVIIISARLVAEIAITYLDKATINR